MYKIIYSRFTSKWLVVSNISKLAVSAWSSRREAYIVAADLNRNLR